MSISEQVKELRTIANNLSVGHNMPISLAIERFRQAADTIESLSAKLQAANMERSVKDCGGWIKCKVRLPEEGQEVIVQDYYGNREISRFVRNKDYQEGFYVDDWFFTANNYLAWHEFPEPYHEP